MPIPIPINEPPHRALPRNQPQKCQPRDDGPGRRMPPVAGSVDEPSCFLPHFLPLLTGVSPEAVALADACTVAGFVDEPSCSLPLLLSCCSSQA